MQVVRSLQKRRPLHFGYHTHYEVGVELHRVDTDLRGLETQGEASGPHPPHVGAQQVVGEQPHVYAARSRKARTGRLTIVFATLSS